jgi:hypothetical protein
MKINILKETIVSFFSEINYSDYILYNEASFQNDLAFHLKKKLENLGDYVIVIERSITNDITEYKLLGKRFVDITIINKETNKKTYIEIKFPKGKKYETRTNNFMLDISFLEKISAFETTENCVCIFLSNQLKYKELINESLKIENNRWNTAFVNLEKGKEEIVYLIHEVSNKKFT